MQARSGAPMFGFMALILASMACNNATQPVLAATPLPPTQAPVIQIQPTVTRAKPSPAAPMQMEPNQFIEEFDGDLNKWTYFIGKNDPSADDSASRPVSDNGSMLFNIDGNLDVYAVYEPVQFENVQIDARVENQGTRDHTVNLFCRLSERGWYEVSIGNTGLYDIYACDYAEGACIVLANGGSRHMKPGQETNEITLICSGRTLRLLVNGVQAGSFTDNRFLYSNGQVGVGVSSLKASPASVAFDWVHISRLE